jgi:hypothetical protein
MSEPRWISGEDADAIKELLVGRRIVAAETGDFPTKNRWGYTETASGRLTLDDGTQALVIGANDCCSHWDVEHLATVDNIITDVRVTAPDFDEDYGTDTPYAIYVVADAAEVNALTVDGSPGNYPYYATGYTLTVVPAEPQP